MTTYEVVYGQNPLSMSSYFLTTSKFHIVEHTLHTIEVILSTIKEILVLVQNIMKQSNQHHSNHSFVEGDHVFLCIQPY